MRAFLHVCLLSHVQWKGIADYQVTELDGQTGVFTFPYFCLLIIKPPLPSQDRGNPIGMTAFSH